MSKYMELNQNPPKITVKKGAKEVLFTTISCMCDNKHTIQFKKNSEGEFTVNGRGNSMSNWDMKYDTMDLTWAADEENWSEVIKMINSGTEKISEVRAR